MSYADVLKAFAAPSVTSVTPLITPEVTKKREVDHAGNPRYPDYPEKPIKPDKTLAPVNPDGLLVEIAQTLQADVHRLRALLSDDDMQEIAEGHYSRSYLLQYFRLMRSDGKSLSDAP